MAIVAALCNFTTVAAVDRDWEWAAEATALQWAVLLMTYVLGRVV